MKKVLIISNVTQGLVNFRRELLEKLVNSYSVIIVAEDNGGKEKLDELGCRFINVAIERHGTNPLNEIKVINIYKRILNSERPDVVLTYTIKPNIYGGAACASLHIPYISNITGLGDGLEDNTILSRIIVGLYKYGLRKSSKVFFQNKENYSFFRTHSIYKGRTDLLPGSGVNLSRNPYEEYPTEKGKITLLVIGRITTDKGIREILAAARLLKEENLEIVLIGNCEEDYLDMIHNAEKDGNIRYVGRQENVHDWLKKCHGVLHASYHEGMSNVLLEAAACGRPVLATNVPGCADTFDEGISGFGFKVKNVDAIVEVVKKFILLPYEKKAQMGANGRKKVEQEFDRQIVVSKYLSTITEITKGEIGK